MTAQTTQQHQAAQAAFAAEQAAERQRLIKLLQVARRDRRWTDEDWAHIKRTHGGADSLTEMDVPELEAILRYAKECGFKVRHATPGGKSRPLNMDRQVRMIRGMWLELHGLGIIRDPAESALMSWASNSRSEKVTTDPALWTGEMVDATLNRLRAFRERELMAGSMFCPVCKACFTPSRKQARAFPKLLCDRHAGGVAYQWRKSSLNGRSAKAHVKHERRT
jgi:phage gp16-like protein